MAKLTIVRGVPGTGKTTFSKDYASAVDSKPIRLETDMHFERYGEYHFDHSDLHRAHRWCYTTAQVLLTEGHDVIVSNTFTRWCEMEYYVTYAIDFGHEVQVVSLHKEYGSIHDVPFYTLESMRNRFESHESIMEKIDEYYQSKATKTVCGEQS